MIPTYFSAYNRAFSDGYIQGLISYLMTTSFDEISGNASQCIKYGKCETHYPQHILIRDELENVSVVLEVPLFKAGRAGTRIFLKIRK